MDDLRISRMRKSNSSGAEARLVAKHTVPQATEPVAVTQVSSAAEDVSRLRRRLGVGGFRLR
jgi:hypothetical protein